ncbi:MAG: 4Fe-4S binding protein [Lachnospiraceae bacterium]|nr:4Fe-4S binding protein [Lachnospiraceae bacterium]
MMFPYLPLAIRNFFTRPSTVQFPKVPVEAKKNYRGWLAYDPEKCVNCGMCIKVCSPSAITRTVEPVEGGEKITYEFNMTSCTFCATCVDFCSTKAIHMTENYHMVSEDPKDLVTVGSRIKETKNKNKKLTCGDACVFCTLCAKNCPEEAITVDRAEKKWEVDHSACVKCGICVEKCPKKCLSFEEPAEEKLTCGDDCVFCTLCAKNCPQDAITVDRAEKKWEVDHSACVKCGICVDKCPKKCLSFQ